MQSSPSPSGLDKAERKLVVPKEEPALRFRDYAIAFHLAAAWRHGTPTEEQIRGATESERALASYEDDMLLYAHRDDPPFVTRVLSAQRPVTVRFPRTVEYVSEGRHYELRSAGGTKRFEIRLGQTWFERSEIAVLTLVLLPRDPSSPESQLDEYALIKLAKLWEGGEGFSGFPTVDGSAETAEGHSDMLDQLAAREFRGWKLLRYGAKGDTVGAEAEDDTISPERAAYRVGTVELRLSPDKWHRRLFEDIATLKEDGKAPANDQRRRRIVALGGILQGLLDFQAIKDDELADVFADVDIDAEEESMRAFHKGTLLALDAVEDAKPADKKADERPLPPLRIDPYLVAPNIVLLHNEQRLKTARQEERQLSLNQGTSFWKCALKQPTAFWKCLDREPIAATQEGLGKIARHLAQDLPNVFHYASERTLQSRGQKARGLDDLASFVRLRVDDLSSVLESRVRQRDRWTAILGIAVGVVTAFLIQQAIDETPFWLVLFAAFALFAVFLWLRDRLF
jgi:hypothetical protein